MNQVEYLFKTREWCHRMLGDAQAGRALPGTLTVEAVNTELDRIEDELMERSRFTADGQVRYA